MKKDWVITFELYSPINGDIEQDTMVVFARDAHKVDSSTFIVDGVAITMDKSTVISVELAEE